MERLKQDLKLLIESSKPKLGSGDCIVSVYHTIRDMTSPDNRIDVQTAERNWENVATKSSMTNWREMEMFNLYTCSMYFSVENNEKWT